MKNLSAQQFTTSKVTKVNYNKHIDLKRLRFVSSSLREHGITTNSKILDVGCGNGNISIFLGQQGFQVLGIDISEKAISKAKSINTLENVDFKVLSAEDLCYANEKYDAIICSEVLEHLNRPDEILQYIHRLLKDDGVLIVTVPNGRGPRETFVTKPIQYLKKKNGTGWGWMHKIKQALGYDGKTNQTDADYLDHVQFFTMKALKKLSEENNFYIKKIGKSNFIEDVFPFSFFTKKSKILQKIDCKLADILPYYLTGGFNTVWIKSKNVHIE